MIHDRPRVLASGPLRVALTGGIATGKSHCLARFAEAGAPTIDADVLARQAVAPGTAGFDAIRSRFGAAVVTSSGGLDREALGRIVFRDAASLRALEAIVHPVVYAAIERWFASLGRTGQAAAIADIPLLYETGRERDFDVVLVAACSPVQQLERLMARAGLARQDAEQRIAAQLPIADKVARADYVIDTSRTREDTDAQVITIWERLSRMKT